MDKTYSFQTPQEWLDALKAASSEEKARLWEWKQQLPRKEDRSENYTRYPIKHLWPNGQLTWTDFGYWDSF